MKKILLLISIFLFSAWQIRAQNWTWSENVSFPDESHSRGMFNDKNGLTYVYGSAGYEGFYLISDFTSDTVGSFLKVYNSSGALVMSKQWKYSFYITNMNYDGDNYIYFSGSFYGDHVIDGIPIVNEGDLDGVTGKMSMSGTILWLHTFGGPGRDQGLDGSFSENDSSVYTSGKIAGTLSLDNVFTSTNQQSAILLHYSKTGTLLAHKEYDFVPARNTGQVDNEGWEVESDPAGNTFLFMLRDGSDWSGPDTVVAPVVGAYLYKLNSSLDTVWSQYIIGPSCYYGWGGGPMRVSDNGDVYIVSSCGAQYGGTATITRFNGASGAVLHTFTNDDGYYKDIDIDGTTLYVVGREGRFSCPCPEAEPGYEVLKIIDDNNVVLGETRATPYANFNYVSKDPTTSIYVNGSYMIDTIYLGPDVLYGDPSGLSMTDFLSRFSTTTCDPPTISYPDTPPAGTIYRICPGDSVTLSVDLTAGSFAWSNGDTGTQTTVTQAGYYSVVNTQPNGCVAYSLPLPVEVNQNTNSHRICLVTYDTLADQNLIVIAWDNTEQAYDVQQINLYKDISGTPTLITTISSAPGTFAYGQLLLDNTTNPNATSADYYISTIDSCGTMSAMSAMHRSIFLSVGTDGTGHNVLSWNDYVGLPYTKYRIWRGMSPSTISLYDSVNVGTNTYTDMSTPAMYYYQVEGVKATLNCAVSGDAYGFSRSNLRTASMTTGIPSSGNGLLTISPNPAGESFSISYSGNKEKLSVTLRNMLGQIIYAESVPDFSGEYNQQINISEQPKGIYFLELKCGDHYLQKKIVKQ
jgi:hypothetical protein